MTLQVSLIRRSSRKQHGTENSKSWLSTCSQVIRPWLLKIQHGKPCHTFAKLDVPGKVMFKNSPYLTVEIIQGKEKAVNVSTVRNLKKCSGQGN